MRCTKGANHSNLTKSVRDHSVRLRKPCFEGSFTTLRLTFLAWREKLNLAVDTCRSVAVVTVMHSGTLTRRLNAPLSTTRQITQSTTRMTTSAVFVSSLVTVKQAVRKNQCQSASGLPQMKNSRRL